MKADPAAVDTGVRFIDGNEACAEGAIAAGCRFVAGYPITPSTEVVEHLRDPGSEFATLFAMLKPGGWLGIMTKLVIDKDAFSRWHYIRDLTHIAFYSRDTFAFIARRFQARLKVVGNDVILLQKT